ncbi:MAG: DUF4334 domain-containing protein [Chloroflexota bacterium]
MLKANFRNYLSGATTAEALDAFDGLDPIPTEFMFGRWFGWEVEANEGHPMSGILDAMGWYGKEFISENEVQPLLVARPSGNTYPIVPYPWILKLSMALPMVKWPAMKPLNRGVTNLLHTRSTQARLRMVEFRGKTSATMIYDNVPIHDHFRFVDDKTVLGLMDFKLAEQPYFFMLQRETA